MPRDGDPMSEPSGSGTPEVFSAGFTNAVAGPAPIQGKRPPRPGEPAILLSAMNARGGSVFLAFTRTRGGIDFWRSLSPARSGLQHVTTFPGPFVPRFVARLLASGAVRPAVDAALAGDSEIDGVDDVSADLLRLAWSRRDGRLDPRAAAVLALPAGTLNVVSDQRGWSDLDELLEVGADVIEGNEEWLAKHRAALDAEVDRRAAGAGEQQRRELRAFAEACLLTLGRLPRADETAASWDGTGLETRLLRDPERRKLRLLQTGRAGKFRVWVRFFNAGEALGQSEFGGAPGWYWDVTNPDPGWIMSCTMGPYLTPEEAWEDAHCLREQE